MSDRPRGLGRGLGALIPSAAARQAHEQDARQSQPEQGSSGTAPQQGQVEATAVEQVAPPVAGEGSRAEDTTAGDSAPGDTTAGDTAPADTAPAGTPTTSTAASDAPVEALPPATAAPDDGAAGSPAYFTEVPVERIAVNPRQPRQVFDEDALEELAVSIRTVGLLQPVVVRRTGPEAYELVMGERRWRASQRAGLTSIPAIVRTTADEDLLRDALLENLHRSQLNPLEEAAAYDQLLQDFACTHEELSQRLGRSRPQISNTLRLLKLPALVQRRLAAGVLSAGHARALLGLPDPAEQERLAQRIVAEGLSVRAVEEIVAVEARSAEPEQGARRARVPVPTSPRLSEISERLSDRFETRVKVDLGRRKGKIVMEFASIDDLERILGLLEPGDAATG
ncbi:ParB family chromosome partitioning protein [Motilibacter rhizosphaerae]|uniref:ParB family chromosome partitioning protein n=1 Tax=Motilibacter rhizosphaerae TaxID=598652 RepID=A0A4Q7NXV6_9ACTN|nr:ParB/RepB/Spo0J family partition protein [Motilibacter rhizosphaerae]RZS91222.1 ParB family chromosome partitioning protein [Motilibacter rhizosphaerae]